jgi:NAD(P)-dependent dehydrogenase (short-subunit alcohol dehydrogenase family)
VQIDRLVLNADINHYSRIDTKLTSDGDDEIWQVNFLGHFYLVSLLQPLLKPGARVVFLSSVMNWFGNPDRFIELLHPQTQGLKYYSDSKLDMAVLVCELGRRRPDSVCIAVNPGSVASDIFRTWFVGIWGGFFARSSILFC